MYHHIRTNCEFCDFDIPEKYIGFASSVCLYIGINCAVSALCVYAKCTVCDKYFNKRIKNRKEPQN